MARRTDVVKLIVSIVPGAVAEHAKTYLTWPPCRLVTFEVDQVDDILARWLITEENLERKKCEMIITRRKWRGHEL